MQFKKQNGGVANPEIEPDHELPAAEPDDPAAQSAVKDSVSLEEELEKVRAERALYLDRAARLQAEFDNFRKRNAREQQEYREYALAEALKNLLPILDSLDRAAKTGAVSLEDFRAGIELIDKQFHDTLAKLGVQPIAAVGELFDPNLHQAVQMVESDEAEDNHVLDEMQRGYKLRDRLLRPAMVRVAHNPKGS